MIVNKVLFSLNDNLLYEGFWDINKFIYKNFFNIEPYLLYNTTFNNYKKSNLYYDKNVLFIESKTISKNKDWFIPWSLFYGASLFPEDTIMTSGIDQIPLSNIFFNKIKDFNEDSYLISFSDAYHNQKSLLNNLFTYPSSHHVSKGKYFKEIFDIKENWNEEINKIKLVKTFLKKEYPIYDNNFWGLDEAYSSYMINNSNRNNIIKLKNFFHDTWYPRRIDRGRKENINVNLLKNGYYTEYHCPRPYSKHKDEIKKILNLRYNYNASSNKKYI